MKKIFLLFFLAIFLFSCVNSPPILDKYFLMNKSKLKENNIFFYKIIIEGDNYDFYVRNSILETLCLNLKKLNNNIIVDEKVFEKDIDIKNIKIPEEILKKKFDYILIYIIRIKELGYSVLSLTDENNIFISNYLYNSEGKLLASSVYNRITSYTISATKKFYNDLIKSTNDIKKYLIKNKKKVK